jgi:hypothetical protein
MERGPDIEKFEVDKIKNIRESAGRSLSDVRARLRGGAGERKVRAPQDTVVDNVHRPRLVRKVGPRIGKVQQKDTAGISGKGEMAG